MVYPDFRKVSPLPPSLGKVNDLSGLPNNDCRALAAGAIELSHSESSFCVAVSVTRLGASVTVLLRDCFQIGSVGTPRLLLDNNYSTTICHYSTTICHYSTTIRPLFATIRPLFATIRRSAK